MSELKALICERCGAAINPVTMQCEYCGTYYKYINDVQTIYVAKETPGVNVYRKRVAFPDYLRRTMDRNELDAYVTRDIRNSFADAIMRDIEYYTEFDIGKLEHVVDARIRVLSPSYKF